METIKPCPFCGGVDTEIRSTGLSKAYWLSCKNQKCSADGPFVDAGGFAATKAWNTRPPTIDPKDVAKPLSKAQRALTAFRLKCRCDDITPDECRDRTGSAYLEAFVMLESELFDLPGVKEALEKMKGE